MTFRPLTTHRRHSGQACPGLAVACRCREISEPGRSGRPNIPSEGKEWIMQTCRSGRGAVIPEPSAIFSVKIRVSCFQAVRKPNAGRILPGIWSLSS
jgi:hypothetical protein